MSNDLVTTGNGLPATPMSGLRSALTPQSFSEVMRFADMMAQSAFVPRDFRGKPGEIVAAVSYGSELGLSPMQSLQSIGVINGRPALYGDGLLAVCQSHPLWGGMEETITGTGDDRTAKCVVKRKGEPDAVRTFSVRDAKLAKLWGKTGRDGQPTPWVTHPERMMQMRARGFALRDQYADALKGLISEAEAHDYPAADRARDVTPQPAPPIVDPADVVEDSGYDDETGEVLDDRPMYPLDGELFSGPSWLDEADHRRRKLSNGELQAWYETNRPVWQQIAADEPELRSIVDILIANVRKQAAAGKAQAEQGELVS